MSYVYKFKAGYTQLGTAAAPSVAPTIDILNVSTDTLLVNDGTTTASAAVPGVYSYEHSAAAGLNLIGVFHTTDTSMDQMYLYSHPFNSVAAETAVVGSDARSGMVDIIAELRTLASCGTADYTVDSTTYWSDGRLQDILDRHAWTVDAEYMTVAPAYISGAYEYKNYYIGRGWLEQSTGGTAIFIVMDSAGAIVDQADYSVDYNIGLVTFDTDTGIGALYMVTATSYDINAAAAEVWRKKAAHYHSAVDFSTDNHSIKRDQLYQHCLQQIQYFESLILGAGDSADLVRSDDLIDG